MTMGIRNVPEDAWGRVRVAENDQCWPWLGTIDQDGYGRIFLSGKNCLAHRVIYALARGAEPGALLVCHSCDNRRCCNPAHLFLGTVADNQNDMVAKGRSRRGESCSHSKLTDVMVREIRRLAAAGHAQRSIARRFAVSQPNVGFIVRRETWRHV